MLLVSGVEQSEALVGDSEVLRPGPVLGKAKQHLAGPMHEVPGGVEKPIAHGARFGPGEVTLEADALAPGEQVRSGEDELHPRGVGGEGAEGHALEAAVPFKLRMRFFTSA